MYGLSLWHVQVSERREVGWLVRGSVFSSVPFLISLDYLESFAVRSKERGMKMVQFEMNLSVPAVPALAELLNCGPRSRLYNSRMHLPIYLFGAVCTYKRVWLLETLQNILQWKNCHFPPKLQYSKEIFASSNRRVLLHL